METDEIRIVGISSGPKTDRQDEETVDAYTEKKKEKKEEAAEESLVVHLMIGFHDICVVTAALPLITLFMCFVTAYVFQAEEVHETHCRVYNVIPSISAITGVSPQRYFWRICIALHVGPRFPIAAVYKNYYSNLISHLQNPQDIRRGNRLINLVFWLNIIEISSLCGVTYISNRENYPIHEKVFIVFMTVSLCHMLATIQLYQLLHNTETITEKQEQSLKWKRRLFIVSIASTIGLILFFLKHRLLCHEMAFSWFALCEYIIASANMAFHCTTMLDFPSEHLLIARGADKFKKSNSRRTELKID